jgi:hypothetical protein
MNLIFKFSMAAFRRSFHVGFLSLFALMLFACSSNDGYEGSYKHKAPLARSVPPAIIDSSKIIYWVGTGSNKAILVVQWNDDPTPDGLVWGYRWDGTKYGIDMIYDIAKADPRFFSLLHGFGGVDSSGHPLGVAVGGFGYDINENGFGLLLNGNGNAILPDTNGLFIINSSNFDDYTKVDAADHWQSGWYNGYWSYWVSDSLGSSTAIWEYSNWGASSRVLKNNSIDAWYFDVDMSTFFNCMLSPNANCDGRDFFDYLNPVDPPSP